MRVAPTPRAITALRRYPVVYRSLRAGWRALRALFWEMLRIVLPRHATIGPPKGTFSALELLAEGKLEGRLVEPAQVHPDRGPKPLRELAGMSQGTIGSWPVFWTRHRRARLVGQTLVVQDDRKRICYEAAYAEYGYRIDPAFNYLFLPPPVNLEGPWTSVISQWSNGFYHWLMDALPRLALLPEFPANTRILVPPRLSSYQKEMLAWLNLEGRYRPTSERHLCVEDFYFSSPTAMTGCYDPTAVRFLREAFLDRSDKAYDAPARFYIRRVGVGRGITNEDEVLGFFAEKGWAIVDTEQLTMAQQIRLFAGAEAICTLHGAALANLVWARRGARVLELVSDTFLNAVYEGLAARVGVEHRFILCRGNAAFEATVDMEALRREFMFLEGATAD
jgi:capsular polysaccharide biosynthesis protein